MKTNKERGFYPVVYTCLNCKTDEWFDIPFGKTIPIMMDEEEFNKVPEGFRSGYKIAPECKYCGCSHWSYGHKPKDC